MEVTAERARFNMIQQQIRPWDVLDDRVLSVMAEIRREAFVPDAYQGLAYADIEIPIGTGSCMLAPKVVGRMLQALDVKSGERVLQIGAGTGYVSACLDRLGGRVTAVEIDADLAEEARVRLAGLELESIEVRTGDALSEPVEGEPFDVIVATGSMPTEAALPLLQGQLAPGGRLFCILGIEPVMEALLVTRVGERDFRREGLFETSTLALQNAAEANAFEF
ncbi:protein-L-isoaspartate O-methyltransferase family protein [Thiocapsa bogorovii]|uniref:protein-L-isoaspartate O-methyltransferase family protein n=1 Tax=Thiocapsa bogorovii TaxID=521689 RepID=UPI001E61BADA|nr:protein-L-isoaspartate O-methyltransferase [Thiocapsa bogorovii]UHD18523.1 protein-L-isoaspartate O-methyltransferase [Thiocapsa bogorovii]